MKIILPFAIIGGLIFAFFGLKKFYNDYTNPVPYSSPVSSQPAELESSDSDNTKTDNVNSISGVIHSPISGFLLHPDGTFPRKGHLHASLGVVSESSNDVISFSDGSVVVDPDRWEMIPFCYVSEHLKKGIVVGICRKGSIYEFYKGKKLPTGYVQSVSRTEIVIIHRTGARTLFLAE